VISNENHHDNELDLEKKYENLRVIDHSTPGTLDAYKLGLNEAQGEFVAFISPTDIWDEEKLNKQVNTLVNHDEHMYTLAKVRYFLKSNKMTLSESQQNLLVNDHVEFDLDNLVARKQLFNEVELADLGYSWFEKCLDLSVPLSIVQKTLTYKQLGNSELGLNREINNRCLLKALRMLTESGVSGVDNPSMKKAGDCLKA